MRYIMTFFWAFALVSMLNYVGGAIANVGEFNLAAGIIPAVIAALLIIIMGESLPKGEFADH